MKSDKLLSRHNSNLIQEFIDNNEYGLAFDGCLHPYYIEGHPIDDDVREKLVETAAILGVELPNKRTL